MRPAEWDHEKFAADLCRQVSLRKAFPSSSSSSVFRLHRPFDQFLIFGPTRHHPLYVLGAFPSIEMFEIPISDIVRYCYPTGNYRSSLRTPHNELILDEFSFKINSSTGPLYGVCAHLAPRGSHAFSYLPSPEAKRACFCLCLLTSIPTFSEHFAFLTHLAGVISSSLPPTDTPPEPPETPTGRALPHLHLYHGFGLYVHLTLPDNFLSELYSYYSHSRVFSAPEVDPILSASLDTLFSLFSPKNILTAVACLLLDAQMLVTGTCLQEITMTVYALTSIMRPIEFAGPVIPLLPSSTTCLQLLHSPTPFVIGCPATSDVGKVALDPTVVVVDTDRRRIRLNAAEFPKFPAAKVVIAQLQVALAQGKGGVGFPGELPKLLGHKAVFGAEMAEEIAGIVREPFITIVSETFDCFFVTDLSAADEGVTVFNRELFRATISREDGQFFEELVNGMAFQAYVEERIGRFEAERGRGWNHVQPPLRIPRPRMAIAVA